jgi:putative FmdB family regulatory protein
MPIYEFYCDDCNTIFSFFSRPVNTTTAPACPKCHKPDLSRRVSLFATTGRAKEKNNDQSGDTAAGPGGPPFDESKMEKAMTTLAGEAERIDENDPRAAANLMRKLSDMTGLKYGDKMQEAISRMEAGEDPESIEAELGGALENEEPFIMPDSVEGSKVGVRKKAPKRDETLYEM